MVSMFESDVLRAFGCKCVLKELPYGERNGVCGFPHAFKRIVGDSKVVCARVGYHLEVPAVGLWSLVTGPWTLGSHLPSGAGFAWRLQADGLNLK